MTEGERNPRATLGTALSWVGSLWAAFSVLWGLGVLQAIGISGAIASEIGGTILPALVLLGIGRALKKRSRDDSNVILPDVSPAPQRTPPILPRSDARHPVPTAPKPASARAEAPRKTVVVEPPVVAPYPPEARETPPVGELDPTPGTPKTSQQLIEEARQRWGTRP
jgi:hypothetical protein